MSFTIKQLETLILSMATAADIVIVEVDEIVEAGELNPEEIITSHLFIDHIVLAKQVLTKEGVAVYD